MRAANSLAVLLVLAILVGDALGQTDFVNAPQLTVGDRWTYRTRSMLEGGFSLDGEATLEVTRTGPETLEGAQIDAVRLSVNGAGTATGNVSTPLGSARASGEWVLAGEQVLEVQGLKVASRVLDLQANGSLQTQPVAIPFALRVQNTSTFRLLSDAWRFPFGIGNSTAVRAEMVFSEDVLVAFGFESTRNQTSGRVPWNVTYAAETDVVVDTPAGRFDSVLIRQVFPDGTFALLFFAPTAGYFARTESYNGTSQAATTELVTYRYQALEPPRLLGLTLDQWAVGAILVGSGVAGLAWWACGRRRRRPPREHGLPPSPP